ncbi:MAG: UDP-3-O-(3-hydroxymyristoyl)glucosamine N-acyltransferase [Fibrobacterota bacterium]|jgi:UDP-3-O-[3-hydroxymyristoyl] glucosamine N-acyltransferase
MPLPLLRTAGELALSLGADLVGADILLKRLGSLESADSGDLSFVDEGTRPSRVWASQAGAFLCPESLCQPLQGRTLLVHPSPRFALKMLLDGPCAPACPEPGWLSDAEVVARFGAHALGARIHPHAVVSPTARLSPGTVIHARVQVGEECVLEPGAVLHPGTVVDKNCHIGSHTVLGSEGFGLIQLGDTHAPMPHHAGVHLREGVRIGPQCNIAAGLLDPTTIDSFCHIDAQVQIGHNCRVGAHCRIAAQVGLSGSVTLGDHCVVGGQAGFADHVRLGERCVVAARAGVTRPWPDGTQLGGFPAQPLSRWRREVARSRRIEDPPTDPD